MRLPPSKVQHECSRLHAVCSSSWGSRCIPTSKRQQCPSPPCHFSTYWSIACHPRRLKYPTQKSARSATCIVSLSAGRSRCSILSKMRGMGGEPGIDFGRQGYFQGWICVYWVLCIAHKVRRIRYQRKPVKCLEPPLLSHSVPNPSFVGHFCPSKLLFRTLF